MSSTETTMEEVDSFLSSTDGIIYRTSGHSGRAGDSMISGPNIASSSTSTDDRNQQQISKTAEGDGDRDLMITSSSGASSSWFRNNNHRQSDHQREVRIFNVDFRELYELAVLQAESERMSGENKRLKDMLYQATTNYNALQMHLRTIVQHQQNQENALQMHLRTVVQHQQNQENDGKKLSSETIETPQSMVINWSRDST